MVATIHSSRVRMVGGRPIAFLPKRKGFSSGRSQSNFSPALLNASGHLYALKSDLASRACSVAIQLSIIGICKTDGISSPKLAHHIVRLAAS